MARQVEVDIEGMAPYSQSRMHDIKKPAKEDHNDFDERIWREKCNYNADGIIVLPAMALKQAIDNAAKMLGERVPGKGTATYSKFFTSGVLCDGDAPLGVHKDEVDMIRINANADGVRGSGKRVPRIFPVIPAPWKCTARFLVINDIITNELFERTLKEAGMFIGVGRFRPEKGGTNGRFAVRAFRWSEFTV